MPAITVDTDTTVAQLMTEHNVKRLPVVDTRGKLVGIVSRKDVLTVFLRRDEDIRADIVTRVFEHGLGIAVNPATVPSTSTTARSPSPDNSTYAVRSPSSRT